VLSREHLPAAQSMASIEALTNDVALSIRGYALSDNQDYLAEGQASLKDLAAALQSATDLAKDSPHLTELRSSVDQLNQSLEDYRQAVAKTVELRTARGKLKQAFDAEAQASEAQCERYLTDIKGPAGGDPSARLSKTGLAGEIRHGIDSIRVAAWAGLEANDTSLLEQARGSFPALTAKLDELRSITTASTNLDQLEAISDSSTRYQKAIADLIANAKDLDTTDDQRGAIRTKIISQTQLAASASIKNSLEAANTSYSLLNTTSLIIIVAILLALILSIGGAFLLSRDLIGGLNALTSVANAIAGGNLYNARAAAGSDEIGVLAGVVDDMQTSLRQSREEGEARDWLKTGLSRLSDSLRGELGEQQIAESVVGEVCEYLGAAIGAFYVAEAEVTDEAGALTLLGSYAYTRRKNLSSRFTLGEGLVGQAARERRQILISNIPEDYIKVVSGLGEAAPRNICVTPLLFNEALKGVLEIGTLEPLSEAQLEYVAQAMPGVAIAIETARSRERIREALDVSQRLTVELQAQQAELQASNEELQTQQEELQSANEELEEQSRRLQESEERLKAQQEELQVTNEELEEQNKALDRQRREVEQARGEIAVKAEELALASKYKSEFLANMSHELRTPLNSLLLLALRLKENKGGNLTDDQIESASVIYEGGNDLLKLINEILDLSKIEAGRMELNLDDIRPADLARSVQQGFGHLADEKGVALEVSIAPEAPLHVVSDFKRLEQVVRNLVSNALKFTHEGSVKVSFNRAPPEADLSRSGLVPADAWYISVQDSGIGIPESQQKLIFEAFQQADGSTSRKYGGTGLGLSISREIVRLLNGEIQLVSAPGEGSTFTVFLPLRTVMHVEAAAPAARAAVEPARPAPASPATAPATETRPLAVVPDDRGKVHVGAKSMLIVEDDPTFAGLLAGQCRERGFLCLVCATGEEALALAEKHLPQGIVLDLKLPGMDGWQVLERLKANSRTRHIPIHIISGQEPAGDALRRGAVGQLRKPVTPGDVSEALRQIEDAASSRVRRVLVVEDNAVARREIADLLADEVVEVVEAASAREAADALRSGQFDCMILDLTLGDMSGNALLSQLAGEPDITVPPVIIHTARDLTSAEEQELLLHSEAIVLKGVRSHERLLDEVSLFLHQVVSAMPERKRQVILDLHDSDAALRGKHVLVVDDDMRTVFAVSKLLADHGMQPHKAENGEKALALLDELPQVDILLTDIMMPVLDGYETIKRIRAQQRFSRLPIIALTAKAMKGDQERCLAAGASDYMPKPVDAERLLSMLRVWLHR
jgi:CheY-like chemotaxis protein/signal transduction histidine kinase/HAMP domain-containing protein